MLIMARDFASRLATATFLVDPHGNLIYFNEAAEAVLGEGFIEGRSMPASEWSTTCQPQDLEGRTVPLESLPLGVALTRHEPAHGSLRITGTDGIARAIEVTGVPLFAHAGEFVGAMAIFWEHEAT